MSARGEIFGKVLDHPGRFVHSAEELINAAIQVVDEKNAELAAVKAELEKLARGRNVIERLHDWARNQRMFEPDKIAADSILSALLERADGTGAINVAKAIIESKDDDIAALRRRVISYQVSTHMTRDELELLEKIVRKVEHLKSVPWPTACLGG